MMRKRQRTAEKNPEKDHISDLPDVLISDILSRLLTTYAVRTSALSRNWRSKWMSIYDIVISDKEACFKVEAGIPSFNCAVTRLLLRTRNSQPRSFHLHCHREGHRFSDFETWISEVLMRRVQSLEIIAPRIKGLDSPWCFSGWNLLTKLTLEISCTLRVPPQNSFPNLKRLYLAGGKHENIKIMTTKLPGSSHTVLSFPVLKLLTVSNCEWLDVTSVEIQAPELSSFTSSCSSEFENYEIKICAPKLRVFRSFGDGNNIFPSAPAVTRVYLNNKLDNETSALRAYQILTKFPNLDGLKIRGKDLQALVHLKPGLIFPTFDQIKELVVFSSCDMEDVLEVLQVLPPLESLTLDVPTLDDFEVGATLTHKILSKLKQVTLGKFSAKKGQYDLAACLLENAKNLEKMTISLPKKALNSEVDPQFLLWLKPEESRCEIVVE